VIGPKRSRRAAVALLIAGLGVGGVGGLAAATLDLESLGYLPIHYFAGDDVVATVTLIPAPGEKLLPLNLGPPEIRKLLGLPGEAENPDPEIESLKLERSDSLWKLTLRFRPWSPGSGSLSAFKVRGIAIPPLPYAAASVLGPEDRELSPPRPQADPPGTALYLYGFLGSLLLLGLGIAGWAAYLLPASRALIARRKAALAFKRLERRLDYLEAESGTADPAAFYAALCRSLRLYLAARFLPEAPALTAAEVSRLPEEAFPASATKDRTAALLSGADEARYGAFCDSITREALVAAAAEARAIAGANEEALGARL
jgi:hypothetical protein